jgi:hypothetical protein
MTEKPLFDFDDVVFDEVDPGECEQNVPVDAVGKYHFEVEEIILRPEIFKEDGSDASPHFVAVLRVLESVPGQSPRGAKFFHRVLVGAKGGGAPHPAVTEAACKFLYAVRALEKDSTGEKFVDPESGSQSFNPGKIGSKIKGAQFVGHIKYDKPKAGSGYEKRLGLHFGNGCFRIDDPKVSNVPKSTEDLAAIGMSNLKTAQGQTGTKSPDKPKDEFSDI